MKMLPVLLGLLTFWGCVDKSAAKKPEKSPADQFWTVLLKNSEEPDLANGYLGHDMIRLFYVGIGAVPTFVTLHHKNDSTWVVTKRVGRLENPLDHTTKLFKCDPRGSGDYLLFKRQTRPDAWSAMDSLLTRCDFWNIPANNEVGLDGVSFVLEVHKAGKYRSVSRWEPEADFVAACRYLIRLTGLKDEKDLYPLRPPSESDSLSSSFL